MIMASLALALLVGVVIGFAFGGLWLHSRGT